MNDMKFQNSLFLWQTGEVTLSDVYKAARNASKDNQIAQELLASLDSIKAQIAPEWDL